MVIPAVDEAEALPATLAAARRPDVEILVVDGGSGDATAHVAARAGARVVSSARGRGCQLAAGAAQARAPVLLFVHADTRLPDGYVEAIEAALAAPGRSVGAFRLRVDGAGFALRWIEWWVAQRCRWLSLPYGDQALFVRTSTYRELGGFRDLAALEDIEFVRRARRHGRVHVLDHPVLTSARAWRRHGVLRMTLVNAACAVAFSVGVPVDAVARWRLRRTRA